MGIGESHGEGFAPGEMPRSDWLAHKSFDGSCPMGPWIVPAEAVGDPQHLGLNLWVNDVLKQDSNTGKMIFTLAEQIASCRAASRFIPAT